MLHGSEIFKNGDFRKEFSLSKKKNALLPYGFTWAIGCADRSNLPDWRLSSVRRVKERETYRIDRGASECQFLWVYFNKLFI
jgi:hypothetical protein